MTITLLTSTPEESLKIERQIIAADGNVEILNPYHEDPVRYAPRMKDPDGMVRRTVGTLIFRSDQVLNLSGQEWIDNLCSLISIPVYHELSEIMGGNPEHDDVEEIAIEDSEPYEDEMWCAGCKISGMNPMDQKKEECPYIDKSCPTFKTFEDAMNGENKL